MPVRLPRLVLGLVVVSLVACGGVVSPTGTDSPGPGAADGGPGIDQSGAMPCVPRCSSPSARPGPLPRPTCPEQEPAEGTACPHPLLRCEYGEGRSPYCRRQYECHSVWTLTVPALSFCPDLPPGYCPSTMPEPGTACIVGAFLDVPCEFGGDILCRCTVNVVGKPGDPGQWLCYGPPTSPDCPSVLPNLGEGCATEGRLCWYDPEGCLDRRLYVVCRAGSWQTGPGPACL